MLAGLYFFPSRLASHYLFVDFLDFSFTLCLEDVAKTSDFSSKGIILNSYQMKVCLQQRCVFVFIHIMQGLYVYLIAGRIHNCNNTYKLYCDYIDPIYIMIFI